MKNIDDVVLYTKEDEYLSYLNDYDIRFLGTDYKDGTYSGKEIDIDIVWLIERVTTIPLQNLKQIFLNQFYQEHVKTMIRSLVTGGAGFIGSNLVDALLEQGHEVVCVDNESASNEEFFWNKKAINIKADVTDYKWMKNAMSGVDYVFHLAAESRLQPAIKNPIEAVVKNCVGTTTVLQCAREAGVKKFMYSSTSSGYGMNSYPNVETQPDDCLNPYSASKVAAEKFCKMYTDLYGLKTVVFRYFNVYGERSPVFGQYAPVIGIFQRQRDAGEPLIIVGDGSQQRD